MKNTLILCIAILSYALTFGQEHVNLKKGFAAEGYDVVSYFQDNPQKGNKKFAHSHEGVKYKFSSSENLEIFKKSPAKYMPQYGGFCAYAVAVKGEKIGVDPETYLIEDGKLYLFYNSWGVNTLDKWNNEGAEKLQKEADMKWPLVIKQ